MSGLLIAPWAALVKTSAGAVLRSDLATLQIGGADAAEFVEEALPLLDGTRDLASLQAALPAYSPSSVAALIHALAARGVLIDGEGDPAESMMEAFLRIHPGDAAAMRARLGAARVVGAGEARWLQDTLDALASAGLGAVARVSAARLESALAEAPTPLLVAAASPEDRAQVEHLSLVAHRAGAASLWAHAQGGRLFIGPVVVPGETACRVCALADINTVGPGSSGAVAVPVPRRIGNGNGSKHPRSGGDERALAPLVALAAMTLAAGAQSSLGGRILVQDRAAWGSATRTLVRVPWCPVCG